MKRLYLQRKICVDFLGLGILFFMFFDPEEEDQIPDNDAAVKASEGKTPAYHEMNLRLNFPI